VVEDNLLNQKIVNFILQKQRAVIKMALNGKQGIELLLKHSFDVVLMDLQMPEMDGYSAIKYIRQEMKNSIPIIALTASLFSDEADECERIGTNACISKPIDPNALCGLISSLVKVKERQN
jgi:CheY-like chemotaxis protein